MVQNPWILPAFLWTSRVMLRCYLTLGREWSTSFVYNMDVIYALSFDFANPSILFRVQYV